MISSSLQIIPSSFEQQQFLLSICKKSILSQSSQCQPQIDFLKLQQKIIKLQQIQQKTCQQIVQFVDQHCRQYIQINQKFQTLQQKINKVQNILKQINIKIKDYSKIYYKNQNIIQEIITKYQTQIIQKILLNKCKEQTKFLMNFVQKFQHIINKSFQNLIFNEKTIIIRFCYKFHYLDNLFNHHLLHQTLPQYIRIYQLLKNLTDQLEFYLSEQLSKLVRLKNIQSKCKNNINDKGNEISTQSQKNIKLNSNKLVKLKQNNSDNKDKALNDIKLCYTYLNKLPEYYQNIESNLIGQQIQQAQKNLINNKSNLISGKNIQIVQQYFKCIFCIIDFFPKQYPTQRILQLIFNQLKKNQIKFIYTYTLSIFPISYNFYMKYVQNLNENLKNILKLNHNWDLKRWIDVREKNILDRSQKDWEKGGDLIKWIDIIFKDNCKIQGVKTQFVKLTIKIVNKYSKFIQEADFAQDNLNKFVQINSTIKRMAQDKIIYYFTKQNQNSVPEQVKNLANKICLTMKNILYKTISTFIEKNIKLIIKSCQGCFQPHKSFIMKIIKSSKQLTQNGIINTYQNVFKPLTSYLENNQKLSSDSKQIIKQITLKIVMKYYDQVYVNQVYQYSKSNLSVEQFSQVMEIIGKQRKILFQYLQQKEQTTKNI